jgi:hypothetical protein
MNDLLDVRTGTDELGRDSLRTQAIAEMNEKGHRSAVDGFDLGEIEVQPRRRSRDEELSRLGPERAGIDEFEAPAHMDGSARFPLDGAVDRKAMPIRRCKQAHDEATATSIPARAIRGTGPRDAS